MVGNDRGRDHLEFAGAPPISNIDQAMIRLGNQQIGGPALPLPTRLRQSGTRSQDEQGAEQKRWSTIMADRLNGYRILILETREEAQFSRLLTEQGADVLQCPMFTIRDVSDP